MKDEIIKAAILAKIQSVGGVGVYPHELLGLDPDCHHRLSYALSALEATRLIEYGKDGRWRAKK